MSNKRKWFLLHANCCAMLFSAQEKNLAAKRYVVAKWKKVFVNRLFRFLWIFTLLQFYTKTWKRGHFFKGYFHCVI